ncbi:hypothetical protein [Chelativorans sp. J32]|uniref:hypothetical protein n=1 Tax=Chelativorans sp. J32 TaxID=935840 RepID=UPI0004AF5CE3|nr:hypothetical protein [Chelativorans sp. J32]
MEGSGFFSEAGSDDGTFVPFTDILFNVLLGFAFMVFIAFSLFNPEAKSGLIDLKAEMIVTVSWPDNHPDDVDTYVEDPAGNVVWYHAREAGLIHLDRDDRGNYRDTIVVNGERIQNPLNQENVTFRGILPGEYVVNIYHYIANSTDDLPVTVKVEKLNPQLQVIYYGTLMLNHRGHERTAVRFTLDEEGNVSDVNEREKSLVRAVRKPKAGG